MGDYGDVHDKTQIFSQWCETTSKSARYVRAQCIMCTTQAFCVNVVIGVLVVLCELHATRVVVVVVIVVVDAVVGLTLGLIAHFIVVVFVVATLHRFFCMWRYTLYTPRR